MLYQLKERYDELLQTYNIEEDNTKAKSLIYVIASNNELYANIQHINPTDPLQNGQLAISSSSKQLLNLGLNLANIIQADIQKVFEELDERDFEIALKALKIRFDHETTPFMLD